MKLTVDALHITLGAVPVLHDVGLHVSPGQVVGLVGPNGSGKSTLLRAVYRSLRPAAGIVEVGGRDVWRLSARAAARHTAAVLQDGVGAGGLTVAETVALGRTPHHSVLGRDGEGDRQPSARHWRTAASRRSPTATSPRSPAVNASASCSPAPSPRDRNSSCWTN